MPEINLLILDFDGVLTDNKVYVFEDGREAVVCHRGDGWGSRRYAELRLWLPTRPEDRG